jgi:peptidoglycan/LPS O-acetylase OafA/YrhL
MAGDRPFATQRDAPHRYHALDGLRGLAALVVVVHHVLLTQPSLSDANSARPGEPDGLAWWLSYSPLHLAWAGREAVYLFFVLSGFVLTLPFLRRVSTQWVDYFPRRLVRLYVPLVAAIVVSAAIVSLVPRVRVDGASDWFNRHAGQVSILGAMTLRSTGALNSALWSLRWELIFSCLLPMFIAFGLIWRRLWLLKLFGALLAIGTLGSGTATLYLPMFAVGVCLAMGRDQLMALARRVPRPAWWALLAAALLLINVRWTTPAASHGAVSSRAATAVAVLGAALLVALFVAWPAARRFGERRTVHWLGTISFSLYLVHEPIGVSVALLLGGRANAGWALLIALPLSLLVAWAFYRYVERPAHHLSRRVGQAAQRHADAGSPRTATVGEHVAPAQVGRHAAVTGARR